MRYVITLETSNDFDFIFLTRVAYGAAGWFADFVAQSATGLTSPADVELALTAFAVVSANLPAGADELSTKSRLDAADAMEQLCALLHTFLG